jgi:hypothetical protein
LAGPGVTRTRDEASLKVRCFAELAQYIYPERKAVDLDSPEDTQLRVRVETIGRPIDFGNLPIPAEFRNLP